LLKRKTRAHESPDGAIRHKKGRYDNLPCCQQAWHDSGTDSNRGCPHDYFGGKRGPSSEALANKIHIGATSCMEGCSVRRFDYADARLVAASIACSDSIRVVACSSQHSVERTARIYADIAFQRVRILCECESKNIKQLGRA